MKHLFACLALALLFSGQSLSSATGVATTGKPLTVDALFHLQSLSDYGGDVVSAVSPDGETIAFVRSNAAASWSGFRNPNILPSDIWLFSVRTGSWKRLTDGEHHNVSYSNPAWSPDGKRLSMISQYQGRFAINVWMRSSGRMYRVTPANLQGPYYTSVLEKNPWITATTLAYIALAPGRLSPQLVQMNAEKEAMAAWQRSWNTTTPSRSILESGIPPNVKDRPQQSLNIVDLAHPNIPRVRTVAHAFEIGDISQSPHHRYLAVYLATAPAPPNIAGRFNVPVWQYRMHVIDTQSGKTVASFPRFVQLGDGNLAWASNESEVALLLHDPAVEDLTKTTLERCLIPTNTCVKTQDTAFDFKREIWGFNLEDPSALLFAKDNTILVRAHPHASMSTPAPSTPHDDWYAVDSSGLFRNLTSTFSQAPSQIVADPTRPAFYGFADGKLWNIRTDGSRQPVWASTMKSPINATIGDASLPSADDTLVTLSNGSASTFQVFNTRTQRLWTLLRPSKDMKLVAAVPSHDVAIFFQDNGAQYLTMQRHGKRQIIATANTWLRDVTPLKRIPFSYTSLKGKPLTGWALLPLGYIAGKRYPTVLYVYLGTVYDKEPPVDTTLQTQWLIALRDLPLQLLARAGYVVLFPSMPQADYQNFETTVHTPYKDVTDGVLPAIDKAVNLGFTDPDRVGVFGHSFGGFSVMGLITQTDRFKAAVESAGISDFGSAYGTFTNDETRYRDDTMDVGPYDMGNIEGGQTSFHAAPWENPQRYIENSPLYHADRVHTPLLLLASDLDDAVPIQQSEEFFSALWRQKKRAEFIRYWGENHLILDNEADVQDEWQHILHWFNTYLVSKAKPMSYRAKCP